MRDRVGNGKECQAGGFRVVVTVCHADILDRPAWNLASRICPRRNRPSPASVGDKYCHEGNCRQVLGLHMGDYLGRFLGAHVGLGGGWSRESKSTYPMERSTIEPSGDGDVV